MRSIGHFIGGKEVKGTSGRTADVFEPMKCPMERMNTSLSSRWIALGTFLTDFKFLGYKLDKLHHRCAGILDQATKTIKIGTFSVFVCTKHPRRIGLQLPPSSYRSIMPP